MPVSRRKFGRLVLQGTVLSLYKPGILKPDSEKRRRVLFGSDLKIKFSSPDEWIRILRDRGYSAARCPVKLGTDETIIRAYAEAAQKAGIVIAEVGAWSNPLSLNKNEQKQAIEKCKGSLRLAELIGARCCVNVSGSKNTEYWAGPHSDNLTKNTFDQIVEVTRSIIDDVRPERTFFTLETMPWSYPNSPDTYLDLIKAVDRKQFAVHLDPVNLINSTERYFKNADIIRECFRKLGPNIRSCHAKDIVLREDIYTVQLSEVRPGLGQLDYNTFLKEISRFPDVPLIMEHLKTEQEYKLAADYIRKTGAALGIRIGS